MYDVDVMMDSSNNACTWGVLIVLIEHVVTELVVAVVTELVVWAELFGRHVVTEPVVAEHVVAELVVGNPKCKHCLGTCRD